MRQSLFLNDFDSFDELLEFPELLGQVCQVFIEFIGVLDLAFLVLEANALLNVEFKRIVKGFELFLDLIDQRGLLLANVCFLQLLDELYELPGLLVQVVESVNVLHFHLIKEEDKFLQVLDNLPILHVGLSGLVEDFLYLLRREPLQPETPVNYAHSGMILIIYGSYELTEQLERVHVVFASCSRKALLIVRVVVK